MKEIQGKKNEIETLEETNEEIHCKNHKRLHTKAKTSQRLKINQERWKKLWTGPRLLFGSSSLLDWKWRQSPSKRSTLQRHTPVLWHWWLKNQRWVWFHFKWWLLDKFCIGDSFYHELTMTANNFPKSYWLNSDGNNWTTSATYPTPLEMMREQKCHLKRSFKIGQKILFIAIKILILTTKI